MDRPLSGAPRGTRLPRHRTREWLMQFAAIVASSLLLGRYAEGGNAWPLGFVALVPWLLMLSRLDGFASTLVSAALMAAGFQLAVFHWFGAAFGTYVGIQALPAVVILVLLGPLLQPQFLAFALVRQWAARRHHSVVLALAGASAWVGCEWLFPKMLGDTLGHGLHPAETLRQAADVGGAAGLTFLLLLVNEAIARVRPRARPLLRAALQPLAVAVLGVGVLWGYGTWRLESVREAHAAPANALRVGLIQSNITDLEHRRQEHGSYAAVRHVLDTHFAMSEFAVREQGADALLWSETIYPTTFGVPKSSDGEALDQEIRDFIAALGVPLVFGTYDRDEQGEYNAAAFLEPARGLLGHYRKTHLFPFTEKVPSWLDFDLVRRLLPWAGNWQPGTGARTFPVHTADGREANVVPMICLDDVHPQLAIDGARLGAEALLGLSNDSWFTAYPQGARLHLAVAAFSSIETRLPQLRATTNGLSAIIDETGSVIASTEMGQQAVLVGEIPLRPPMPTLMLRWGDWVGRTALLFLLGLAAAAGWRRYRAITTVTGLEPLAAATVSDPFDVVLLTPLWRYVVIVLRVSAALALAWLTWRMWVLDGFQVNSLIQVRGFVLGVALPLLLAWAVRRIHTVAARIDGDVLVCEQATQRIEIPLARIESLHAVWAGGPGAALQLALVTGKRWPMTLSLANPQAFASLLVAAGAGAPWADPLSARVAEFAAHHAVIRHRRWDNSAVKFVLFPLLPALVAFRLHQHITFGGTFGELYTYGLGAWLTGLMIWWAAWSLGLMLFAAGMRFAIELIVTLAFLADRHATLPIRRTLEYLTRIAYYLGTPAWLAARLLWG